MLQSLDKSMDLLHVCMVEKNLLTTLVFCRFICFSCLVILCPSCVLHTIIRPVIVAAVQQKWLVSSSRVHYGIKSERGSGFMGRCQTCAGHSHSAYPNKIASVFHLFLNQHSHTWMGIQLYSLHVCQCCGLFLKTIDYGE